MKKFIFVLIASITCTVSAQIVFNKSFSHMELYGKRGTCLFPMDGDDFAVLTGIVECDKDAIQILDAVNAWFGRACFNYKLDVDNDEKFVSNRQLIFKAEMPIGHKLLFDEGTPAAITGVSLDWDVSESDLTFVCKIDIKDNKFRYTFYQIIADRWRLRGDAETEGPINDLHWQRINCLNNKLDRTKQERKKKELQAMIEYEKAVYKKEYQQMKQLEKDLINCVKLDAENDEFDF